MFNGRVAPNEVIFMLQSNLLGEKFIAEIIFLMKRIWTLKSHKDLYTKVNAVMSYHV